MFRAVLPIALSICASLPIQTAATDRMESVFPLRISGSGRYFIDQKGMPFLIQGDTAWSLIAQLTLEETENYLNHRKAQGFNAILVNLIERKFSKNPPSNASGIEPFLLTGCLSPPNEAYFAHADAVIRMAAQKGLLVFLAPGYLGWRGTDEGWLQEVRRAGKTELRKYGRFVGHRLKGYDNIIWVIGGDYSPSLRERWYFEELAEGIRESGANQLMTAHCAQESPADVLGNLRWLDFNNIYSYSSDIFRIATQEYRRMPIRPFVLIEALYEGEHDCSPETIRKQAYASLIGGAAGHFFGNNPVWNFGSPIKVFISEKRWIDALGSQGAQDMRHLWTLFKDLAWQELKPDLRSRHTGGLWWRLRNKGSFISAATKDGRLFIAYISGITRPEISFASAGLAVPDRACWYDPTSGNMIPVELPVFKVFDRWKLPFPGKNASGSNDWVLVLERQVSGK